MIRILTLFILFIHFSFCAYSQELRITKDSLLIEYLNKISQTELRKNLSVLASDSLEGRETGRPGQKKAANYLVENLQNYGVSGAGDSLHYYQRFKLYKPQYENIYCIFKGDTLRSWEDFYTFSTANDTVYSANGISFLGYGIDSERYSDYESEKDYDGLGVIFTGEPYRDGKYLISGSNVPSEWSENIQLKVDIAQQKGLSGLVIINEQFDQLLPRVIYYQKNGRPRLDPFVNSKFPVLVMGTKQFSSLFPGLSYQKTKNRLNEQKKLKNTALSQAWSIHYETREEKLFSENVLGIIKGKELPNEYVFMTAHYDHLGKQGEEIYNGADDDGSGTTSLLEIARLFSEAADSLADFPKRSVVFMWVSGEEKGLLGSKYYTDNPIHPLEATVVDLNIDMVGRRDTLHTANDSSYIYLIGSDKLSSELHNLSEQVNEIYSNFDLDYTYNDDQHPSRLYYRSDHYNFAKHNIPVIFYFGGMHEDYHKPTDEVNKIDFEILSGVTRLVMATSWHITNAEKRIEVDKPVKLVR
jgi:hypothetical protein